MKLLNKGFVFLAIVFFAFIIITGCGQSKGENQDVQEEVLEKEEVVFAFGEVKAAKSQNIFIDFPATVENVDIKNGSQVNKGDILVTLDINEYLQQIANKEKELTIAQDILIQLETSQKSKKIDLELARFLLNEKLEELEKKELLFKEGAISQGELEQFQNNIYEKESSLKKLKLSFDKNQEMNIQKERAAILKSELEQMKRRLEKPYLDNNHVVCPLERAIVSELGYQAGDRVSDESKVLSLYDIDSIIIEADISEEFIKEIKIGDNAIVTPLADREKGFSGKVNYISKKAIEKRGERVIPVEIIVEDSQSFLMPGFNVDIEIEKE